MARPQGGVNDIGAYEVISVSTPPPIAEILFTTHWFTVAPGADFTLTLQAIYADGLVDTGLNNLSATISEAAGPRGGSITGPLTVAFVNGIATFSNLVATELGVYTLTVPEPGGLTATTTINAMA